MDPINLSVRINPEIPDPRNAVFQDIVVYGAGNTGREVFRLFTNLGRRVRAFLDIKATANASYENVPILHPAHDAIDDKLLKNSLAIVAIFNRDVALEPVVKLLRKRGFRNIITFVQLHHFFAPEMGDRYWLGSRSLYQKYEKELMEVDALWSDDLSRSVFRSVINFRLTGDHTALSEPEGLESQYFPRSLPAIASPLRFIDGGAYDGDTLKAMAAMGIHSESVVSFEPDLKNFANLSRYCKESYGDFTDEITLYPCAIWSKTEYLKFSSDSTEASQVIKEGNGIPVLGVSIDEILPFFKPNFIKMDIEGAEFDGLLGASQTIRELKPDLGICVYHTPDHLWRIPLLIKSWNQKYKFHLRSHGNNGFDLVLYAKHEE